MLSYRVAYYLPTQPNQKVLAKALDFPGAVSQGFDLADARVMIASALEDLAEVQLELGNPLPSPDADATDPEADLIELVQLKVAAGAGIR
ncbi:MAG: hypothetical protein GC160_06525 [Acidobacteria bacterium]|nr:hypothetical protein [Acidobacteriota bacterium]